MELPKNLFKQSLASKQVQYGLFLGLPDNSVAEINASSDFDWLMIDHEHGPFDLTSILHYLQAIVPYPIAPVVRPATGDIVLLKKLLDIGVQSFLVPMVNTPEQARDLVKAVRYPPQGLRGLGTSVARAARWNQIPGYAAAANDEICLIVQAETPQALENLDDILQVEGVDGVFFGPSDLCASMGHLGNPGHPEVIAAISKGLNQIKASGKHAGVFCMDPALARDYVEQGANFLAVATDTLVLSKGLKRTVTEFREGKAATEEKPQAGY